jgi:hypothetical protein
MRSPSCPCVCVCVSGPLKQILNKLIDFHEIQYRDPATEGDPDAIISNPVASTIIYLTYLKSAVVLQTFSVCDIYNV